MITLKRKIALICFPLILFLGSFQIQTQSQNQKCCDLTMKWYKAYPSQNFEIVKLGMLWSFSYLGAMLPKNCLDSAIQFKDSSTFNIHFDKLGFNPEALKALSIICDSIKKSEEYQQNHSLDLSRFFSLTLYSPFHYYQITQVIPNLSRFNEKYNLQIAENFGVTVSSVSKAHRLIKFSKDTTSLFSTGLIAEEGEGSLLNNTFKPEVYEAIDIMPNGQFRYAIYDEMGKLTDASSEKFSKAGSIGKCMWCHETYIQPLYTKNIAVKNMLDNQAFEKKVSIIQKKLDTYRKTLNTTINFENKQDHTSSELLYISFMEPSLMRLTEEFRRDSLILKNVLKLKVHNYEEFPFLGKLFLRQEVDKYFPYKYLEIPKSIREKSNYQPNYFK